MCILNGTTFPSCSHGIRVFWRCPTYTGPAPTAGELPACPQFQDRRVQVDFPCARCSGANTSTQKNLQEGCASPARERAETHDETLERARLARVASEERMRREGTTLEEGNHRSREDKAWLAWLAWLKVYREMHEERLGEQRWREEERRNEDSSDRYSSEGDDSGED